MNRILAIALLLASLTAFAEEGTDGIHVDIKDVVATGKVEPVNGITSSGQPNEEALDVFAESGYEVVIDMRGPDEDRGMDDFAGAVEEAGMTYISFPVVGRDAISFETAQKLDALLQEADGLPRPGVNTSL